MPKGKFVGRFGLTVFLLAMLSFMVAIVPDTAFDILMIVILSNFLCAYWYENGQKDREPVTQP